MASLVDLTKKVASNTVGAVGGVAKSIGSTIASSVSSSTGISAFKPSNILMATAEAAGLEGLIPAGILASSGGGKRKNTSDATTKDTGGSANSTNPGADSARPVTQFNTKRIEDLLNELVNINSSILNINNQILNDTRTQTAKLSEIAAYFERKEVTDIEDKRERVKVPPTAPAQADQQKKQGGGILGFLGSAISGILGFAKNLGSIFSSILKFVPTILSAAGSLLGFFGKIGGFFIDLIKMLDFSKILGFIAPIGRFFSGLLSFLGRFAGPIAAVLGVLLSLEQQDWSAFFKKFTDAWDAFLSGDWLTGIVNVVTALPELLIKGIGRLVANIAEFFGFDKVAKSINDFLDNFDLAKTIIDGIKSIGNMISDGFDVVVDTFKKFWASFNVIDPILDAFNYVKDAVTGFFGSVKDAVGNVISGAGEVAGNIASSVGDMVSGVWNFFKSLPGKIADLVGSMIPDSLKGLWNKVFGSSKTETPAATPTPASTPTPAAQTPTPAAEPLAATPAGVENNKPEGGAPGVIYSRTSGAAQQQGVTPQYQYIQHGGIVEQIKVEGAQQEVPSNLAAQKQQMWNAMGNQGEVPGLTTKPKQSFIPSITGNSALTPEMQNKTISEVLKGTPTDIQDSPVFKNISEENERQMKAQEAARLGMSQNNNQPIVINAGSPAAAPQQQSGGSKENRTSGAALTAPVQSHMDRALYGSGYGAGVP